MNLKKVDLINATKLFFSLFSLFILFFTTSCENFLQGYKFREELEAAVTYANSPTVSVRFFSEECDVSPNGYFDIKETQDVLIIASPYSDYEFVKWQVKDSKTKRIYSDLELKEFIEIKNPFKKETQITLKKNVENLQVQPLCAPRPKVLRLTPNTDGVYRDSPILIAFDMSMNKYSIYYTGEEQTELLANNYELFFFKDIDGIEYCYAYKNESNEFIYKNISITSSGKNILNCFKAPYFNSNNILVIPTQNGTNAPRTGSSVTVEISRNVYYTTEDSIDVCMSGSTKWYYGVNSKLDDVEPVIEETKVYKNKVDSNISTLEEFNINTAIDVKDIQTIKDIYLPDNKIKVYSKMLDDGSGPENIHIKATRIYDECYTPVEESGVVLASKIVIEDKYGYFGDFNESTNMYKESEVDLSSLTDGVYRIDVIAEDANRNTVNDYTYVLKKTESNVVSKIDCSIKNTTFTLTWENCIDMDLSSLVIRAKDSYYDCYYLYNDSQYSEVIPPRTQYSKYYMDDIKYRDEGKLFYNEAVTNQILSLSHKFYSSSYDFDNSTTRKGYVYMEVSAKDIFGHDTKTIELYEHIRPEGIKKISTRNYDIMVEWDSLYSNYKSPDGFYLYYGTDKENLTDYIDLKSPSYTFFVADNIQLSRDATQYFKVIPYYDEDGIKYFGEESDTISRLPYAALVSDVSWVGGFESVTLYWKSPDSNIDSIRIYYDYHEPTLSSSYVEIPAFYSSYTISGLNFPAGSKNMTYSFHIYSINSLNSDNLYQDYNHRHFYEIKDVAVIHRENLQ